MSIRLICSAVIPAASVIVVGLAGLAGLVAAPAAVSATAGLPVSGACTIDAGFDGQLLTVDDDFAPFPFGGDIVSAGGESGTSGEESALIGEACWVSAAPPVPAPASAVQVRSSPPVPEGVQPPPAVLLTPVAQPVPADRSVEAAAAAGIVVRSAPQPAVGRSEVVPQVLVAVFAAVLAGLAGVSVLRRRRPTWR